MKDNKKEITLALAVAKRISNEKEQEKLLSKIRTNRINKTKTDAKRSSNI